MSLIFFYTSEVKFDDTEEHMQNHAKRFGMSTTPTKLLIGGVKAKKTMFATPLLKWYLDHGMKITKVYQVVEYNRLKCFQLGKLGRPK